MITFGSLFAGIGGFDLGFERAGMLCKWQVEIDEFANTVLRRHWPEVMRHDDIRTFATGDTGGLSVSVISGGFPCQDISIAGRGKGLSGERSGLWREMHRVVDAIRPRFVVIENTPPLLTKGLHIVLRDLAEIGYDAEWHAVSAKQFGLAHKRDRLFIIAYTNGVRWERSGCDNDQLEKSGSGWGRVPSPDGCKDGWDLERWVSSFYSVCGFPASDTSTKRVVDELPSRLDRCKAVGNSICPIIAEWIGRRIVTITKQGE